MQLSRLVVWAGIIGAWLVIPHARPAFAADADWQSSNPNPQPKPLTDDARTNRAPLSTAAWMGLGGLGLAWITIARRKRRIAG